MKTVFFSVGFCLFSVLASGQQKELAGDKQEGTMTFTLVEKEANFPGGAGAWGLYLQKNLNTDKATKKAKPGKYAVTVQFKVDKEGNVSEAKVVEDADGCPSCGKEALRVISKGPKWEPAMQNGHNVIYLSRQKITFMVND